MKKHPINPRVAGLKRSATLAINERSNALRKEGRRVYKLGLGQSPFPVPDSVVEELRAHAHEKDYLNVQGFEPLREAVAQFHRKKDGVIVSPDHVMVGPGSKELLFLLQYVFDGNIMLPNPCWVSYEPQAKIIGRKIDTIDTYFDDRWLLDPDRFDDILSANGSQPELLILNYPSNPHGQTYTPEHLETIANIARKHGALLLSDEIYGHLTFYEKHTSIAKYYPEGTIILSGISKWCGAGGWRLGTFAFPKELEWLKEAMVVMASETFTSVSAPIQHAAIRAFKGGSDIERYLRNERRILADLGGACTTRLQDAQVRVHEPEGGFYLFPDFGAYAENLKRDGISTSSYLCDRLLDETGVAIIPGSSFGRPDDELTARISYVDFDGARALIEAERIPADEPLPPIFIKDYCAPTLEAMDRITDWLQQYK